MSPLTGVPYFVDSEIPSAVFLGLHLLVTDPSTSPRTPLGRAIFGVLYGVGVFALYALLERARAADFLRQAAVRAAPQPGGARRSIVPCARIGERSDPAAGWVWTRRSAAPTSRTWRCGWPSSAR